MFCWICVCVRKLAVFDSSKRTLILCWPRSFPPDWWRHHLRLTNHCITMVDYFFALLSAELTDTMPLSQNCMTTTTLTTDRLTITISLIIVLSTKKGTYQFSCFSAEEYSTDNIDESFSDSLSRPSLFLSSYRFICIHLTIQPDGGLNCFC